MPMSHDRVRFTMHDSASAREATVKALRRAFDMSLEEASDIFDKRKNVICRPSQFARFIIFRFGEGLAINRIACLNPELFSPSPAWAEVDVADRPNNSHYPR